MGFKETNDIFALIIVQPHLMIEQFSGISQDDYQTLKDSISLITVLIAGADGHIDRKEKEWAEKVTNIRSYALPDGLKEFYLEVGEDFAVKLGADIALYDIETEARNKQISQKLGELNAIFPKIVDREVAIAFYESLLSFARHVARASGGFLSWGSVNAQEKRLLGLDAIHPVDE